MGPFDSKLTFEVLRYLKAGGTFRECGMGVEYVPNTRMIRGNGPRHKWDRGPRGVRAGYFTGPSSYMARTSKEETLYYIAAMSVGCAGTVEEYVNRRMARVIFLVVLGMAAVDYVYSTEN